MSYRTAIEEMGQTYGVTVLAPDGGPGTSRAITDPITGHPCKEYFPALNKKTGKPYKAGHWTQRQLAALRDSLGLVANAMPGQARVIMQDVAFIRLYNDNTGGYARYCAEAPPAKGGCLGADWSGTPIKAVIVFHELWDEKSDHDMQYTVIHELGHHVSQYLLASTPEVVTNMYRWYADGGLPDKRADCREHYFTGAFARYVFEQAAEPIPEGAISSIFGPASRGLDQIFDERRTPQVSGRSLRWYMEKIVIPAIA